MEVVRNRNQILLTALGYLGFLLTWGIGQWWARTPGETARFWSLLFFLVIFMAVFGVTIPLILAKRFGFEFYIATTRLRMTVGLGVLTFIFIAGVFFSGTLAKLLSDPPSAEGIIKYLLLFVPMALGICLQCFFLIPQVVKTTLGDGIWSATVSVISASISVGLGFLVDQLFTSVEDAITMAILGLFYGLGSLMTRSLPLTYLFFLPVMLVNTLSEGKYYNEPWGALIVGFGISSLVVFYFGVIENRRETKPPNHSLEQT